MQRICTGCQRIDAVFERTAVLHGCCDLLLSGDCLFQGCDCRGECIGGRLCICGFQRCKHLLIRGDRRIQRCRCGIKPRADLRKPFGNCLRTGGQGIRAVPCIRDAA